MADVLEIAKDRRLELKQEVSKLDDFIRMAESLVRGDRPGARRDDSDENPLVLGRGEEAGVRLAGRAG